MKCHKCQAKVYELALINENGEKEIRYCHADTVEKCDLANDGIAISVVDERLNNKFNQIVLEKGIEDSPEPKEKVIEAPTEEIVVTGRLDLIKDRLCSGELSLNEFDEIKKRIE